MKQRIHLRSEWERGMENGRVSGAGMNDKATAGFMLPFQSV